MPSFFVRRAISGGSTETFGPYSDLKDAMDKGCELLQTHGATAFVSIDDGTYTIRGLHDLQEYCARKQQTKKLETEPGGRKPAAVKTSGPS
jgi:hypothetical protein